MSDAARVFRAINGAFRKMYPGEPRGNVARHLTTLAAMTCGIIRSQKTHLPAVANEVPENTNEECRARKYDQRIRNERIEEGIYFIPFVQLLMERKAHETLVLAIDGSIVFS